MSCATHFPKDLPTVLLELCHALPKKTTRLPTGGHAQPSKDRMRYFPKGRAMPCPDNAVHTTRYDA